MVARIKTREPILAHRIIEQGKKVYYKVEQNGKSACGETVEKAIQTLLKKFACGW